MIIEGSGGSGMCASTGCVTDLNRQCPAELRVSEGDACKSACEAFGSPEYCCSGAYNTPATCKPSVYAEMFKIACPRSYSYAYDDPTSTFTCTGADYTVTFCPSMPSQKSSRESAPTTIQTPPVTTVGDATPTTTNGDGSSVTGADPGLQSGTMGGSSAGTLGSGTGSGSEAAVMQDGSWLAGLAMGDSTRRHHLHSTLHFLFISLCFSFFL